MKWFIVGIIFYNGAPHNVEPVGPYATQGNCEAQKRLIYTIINQVPRTGAMLYCKELPDA